MLYLAALIFAMTLSASVFADDKMYKCDDGTFTNRADLHCPSYELRGSLMIMSGNAPMPSSQDKPTDTKVMMRPVHPRTDARPQLDTSQDRKAISR